MKTASSIKFKFVAGLFLIVTVVTVILAVVSFAYEKRAIENRLYAQLNAIADLKKEMVVEFLNERANDLKTLSASFYQRRNVSILLDPASGALSKKEAARQLLRRLNSFKDIYVGYLTLEILDLNGRVIISSAGGHAGLMGLPHVEHKAALPLHAEAFKQDATVILQDNIGTGGTGHLEVATGMRDEQGRLMAVLISEINLADTISPLFTDYTGLGRTGETTLMRQQKGKLLQPSPMRHAPFPIDGQARYGEEYMKIAMLAVSGNEGMDQAIDYRGKAVIGAYRHIPNLGWGVVTKIDRDEAFAEITALRKKIFLLALAILAVMLGIAYVMGRKLTAPIRELIMNTKAVAAGRYAVLADTGRADEFGELERNFNEMLVALDAARLQTKLMHENLANTVSERTANLADANIALSEALENIQRESEEKKSLQAQLLHAQKMEAVGTLAGGIAHDFNNILTAIIGYGNVMRMRLADDDPHREYLDQILSASERAANLTRSLLAFSRKQIINPRPVNLNEIIRLIQKLLARLIGEDIELRVALSESDPVVMADPGQLEQVLMNLATNARDAMPGGGCFAVTTELVTVDEQYVSMHGYGEAGRYAVITVSDTGLGMAEETRARIFEPFFTTKEMGKGTGLGLSIVYGIVKAQRGYVNCYSEPGKGTTFKIYLPLTSAAVDAENASKSVTPRGGGETVLVAEDSEDVRNLTTTVLSDFGYSVIEAVDGEDAVKKFLENRDAVRLLLFDIIMPKKNGKDAYEEIRAIRPDIKVIFTSGYTADIIHQRGFIDEGLTLLTKPLSPRDLLAKIHEVIEEKPSAGTRP
jgi:signal transduction histidine kinase/ActR/RegA family two-component response regulator